MENYKSKRQHRALDVKVNYANKARGQKYINYLGPTIFIHQNMMSNIN